jgi:ABC-type lipoprotein export system ATPase subunit
VSAPTHKARPGEATPELPAAAQITDLCVEYRTSAGSVRALDGVTARFDAGSSAAIVGRSGSGKSTMVAVLSLLRRPTTGTVTIAGIPSGELSRADLARLRSSAVGVVFQSFHLEPALTAAENVMLPWFFQARRTRERRSRTAARRHAGDVLDLVGIADLAERHPGAMSGGQRQRVAIARALFSQPRVFLADEPTGNLDEETAEDVSQTLFELPRTTGTSVIVVTHDSAVAAQADRTLTLSRGRLAAEPIRAPRSGLDDRTRGGS